MSRRSQYPPWNFKCPYKDCCPYLAYSSTSWIWEEYQGSSGERLDHWRVRDELNEELDQALQYIKKLKEENEDLRAKYKALHQRQFKANKKSKKKAASHDDTEATTESKANKRGAPVGHPGWSRPKPDHIDKTVVVEAPDVCPHCGGTHLTAVDEVKEHLQEDIVLQPQTYVTNFKHAQAFCTTCKTNVVKEAEGELLNCSIGPLTRATAVFLRYGLRIPYRKTQELFKVLFNMSFVPASAMNFDRQATTKGQPLYDDLREKLRSSITAFADETSWREDGVNHYLWYGGNEHLAYFYIDPHRSSIVAQAIFGDSFSGILHTDGYAAYNAVNPDARQSCLAHLIRKAKEIKEEILLKKKHFQDHKALTFCDKVVDLFKKACGIKRTVDDVETVSNQAQLYKKQLYQELHSICEDELSDKKAETLRSRIIHENKEYHQIFAFLDFPAAQPTNNHAEQSLRTMVIFRKICFGTRSPAGSFSHSVLPSLIITAQRQGNHPLAFLQTLFLSDTPTAQAALYNSS